MVAGAVEWSKVAWIELYIGELGLDIVIIPHTILGIEQNCPGEYQDVTRSIMFADIMIFLPDGFFQVLSNLLIFSSLFRFLHF